MFWYIRKNHLFASFASYSLQNVSTDSHTNIQFDGKKIQVSANICCKANFQFRDFLKLAKLQIIRLGANIRKI
jgi:hypothetical protein